MCEPFGFGSFNKIPLSGPAGSPARGPERRQAEREEEIRSYRIGRRPLLSGSEPREGLYNLLHNIRTRMRFEHQQFVGSDKRNFGMQKGGTLFEDTENLDKYDYDTPEYGQTRYNAEIIDQARAEVEREWAEKKSIHTQRRRHRGTESRADPDGLRYNLPLNNCQDYVVLVLERAEQLARDKGVRLTLP